MTSPVGLSRARASRVRLLIVVGLILWLLVVFGAYYAVHKPVPDMGARVGDTWGILARGWSFSAIRDVSANLGIAFWLFLLSLGIGSLLREGILGDAQQGLREKIAIGAGLGYALLAYTFFFLGLAQGFAPIPAFFALGLLSGLGLFGLRRLRGGQSTPLATMRDAGSHTPFWVALKILLLCTGVLVLTRSLTPPIAWDSMVYHLAAPQRYIQAGGVIGGIDIPHFYFPALVEQLFTVALLVKGDILARLLHLTLAATGALALYAFLDRHQGPRAGWLGLALLASATSLLSLATQAYVEWGLLTFGLLAFWALHEALESGSARWLLLSGCFAGLVMGVKYTGVIVVLPLGLLLSWRLVRGLGGHSGSFPQWRHLGLWLGATSLIASPWYVKNLVLTGNPVYPFFLGGWNWDDWKTAWFSRPGTGLIMEPTRILMAPWELTVLAAEGNVIYDVTLGPLFLSLLPLLLVSRPEGTWVPRALAVTVIGYGAWLYGAAQSELLLQGRLLLPVLPFLATLLAGGLAQGAGLSLPSLRVEVFLRAAVLLAVVLNLLTIAMQWIADPPLPYLVGAESRAAYQERHLGAHFRALAFLNTNLSSDAKALFLWEPRSYLCQRECQPDALLYNWRYLLSRYATPQAIQDALRADGYSHLLLYGGGLRFFSEPPQVEVEPPHIEALVQFEARYLDRIYGPPLREVLAASAEVLAGGGYAIYQLRAGP